MKQFASQGMLLHQFVAPRAGAWIETFLPLRGRVDRQVAPRAGAWIETFITLRK